MAIKKSKFVSTTVVEDGSTFDFVINGQNLKIKKSDFLSALGVTGTLSQVGAVTGTPVLAFDGANYLIRNLEAGDGIEIDISPENGITIHVPSVDSEVGTLEQVTTNGNETDQGMVLLDGTQLELKAVLGHSHGFAAVNPTNVVTINCLEDFPAAVANEIELVPASGDPVTYVIAAENIDVSPNVFTVTNGSVVIRGAHRTASRLTTSAAGTMFTSSESEFFQELMAFDCPNAKWLDFASTAPFTSLANQNVIIIGCTTVATIAGAFTTSLRTMTVVSASVNGILWTGTDGNQINISNFFGIGWTNTLLDLGTATFDLVNIVGNNRFISPGGTTILSGLTANGNFNTGAGRGVVENNIFNGSGTAIAGIDSQDTQWNMASNRGLPDTKTDAGTFLSSTETVTIGSIGVYVPIAGTNWSSDVENRFTTDSAGLVTFIGLEDEDVFVSATATLEKVGGGSDLIATRIAINGTTSVKTGGGTESTAPTQTTSQGLFTLSTGDTIQLYVANTGSTSNITVTIANMIMSGK